MPDVHDEIVISDDPIALIMQRHFPELWDRTLLAHTHDAFYRMQQNQLSVHLQQLQQLYGRAK